MLDQETIRLARDRIHLEIREQNARIGNEIQRRLAEMSARGVLNSGITLDRVASLCADAAKDRAQLAWLTLHRFVTTSGVRHYAGIANDLKEIVAEFLPLALGDLKGYVTDIARRLSNPDFIAQAEQRVAAGRAAGLEKVNSEIELFAVSIKRQQDAAQSKGESQIFNIYSPVGSIQTGPNAVAFVTQTIDAATRKQITSALNVVEEMLAATDSLPAYPKAEVIEIVREAKGELAKPEPNTTKLRSLLSTTATAIQTVASMKPAYELLKAGLAHLGITLP
jgi:hypothetical protein